MQSWRESVLLVIAYVGVCNAAVPREVFTVSNSTEEISTSWQFGKGGPVSSTLEPSAATVSLEDSGSVTARSTTPAPTTVSPAVFSMSTDATESVGTESVLVRDLPTSSVSTTVTKTDIQISFFTSPRFRMTLADARASAEVAEDRTAAPPVRTEKTTVVLPWQFGLFGVTLKQTNITEFPGGENVA